MLQVVMCVWVQCDQCGDILDALEGEPGHVNERAAYVAARARGWRGDPDGRWWCSACALVLTCQRRGHEFTQWRRAHRGGGGWSRRCQRCCVLERRSPDQSPLTPHHPDHVGDGVGVLVMGEVA
jgi:hypothetical protein